jgi:hypothetical protein
VYPTGTTEAAAGASYVTLYCKGLRIRLLVFHGARVDRCLRFAVYFLGDGGLFRYWLVGGCLRGHPGVRRAGMPYAGWLGCSVVTRLGGRLATSAVRC